MTILLVWALIAGQPVMATHSFGSRNACEDVRALVIHEITREGAKQIVAICSERPAL